MPQLQLVIILTAGFSLAFLFGYIAQRLKASPIFGYLLAGFIIGPYSPGYVANIVIAEQLADIGVILLMFGVGLHFSWNDLVRVKSIAIPGAIGQTAIAALLGTLLLVAMGKSLTEGVLVGFAIGVASTAVLVRMLIDNNLLGTVQGHIAVGWLIVEDIFTVLILLLLPQIAPFLTGQQELSLMLTLNTVGAIAFKLGIFGLFVYLFGHNIAKTVLVSAIKTRSYEIFTLGLLAIIFLIAGGAAWFVGVSLALGAFIAGVVVGKTELSYQAAAITLPLKDAFATLFFIAAGMLFNPAVIYTQPLMFLGLLGIILIAKPLTAFLIMYFFKYPLKVAAVVAISLAQIGEFSFILAEEAWKMGMLPDEGYDVLVASALVSIAINPFLFELRNKWEAHLQNGQAVEKIDEIEELAKHAIIIGYGPAGWIVAHELENLKIDCVIIDHNLDNITEARETGWQTICGNASHPNILESAHIDQAIILIITIPEIEANVGIIQTAKHLNSNLQILARATYLTDQHRLDELAVAYVCTEQEAINGFQRAVRKLVTSA